MMSKFPIFSPPEVLIFSFFISFKLPTKIGISPSEGKLPLIKNHCHIKIKWRLLWPNNVTIQILLKLFRFICYPRKRFHELNKSEWYNRKVYSKHCDEEGDCKTIDYVSLSTYKHTCRRNLMHVNNLFVKKLSFEPKIFQFVWKITENRIDFYCE